MSTAILIDPSEGAMNSLPSTLKDIFKKIVQKLKSLYKGLIGEFNNRNFAPRTLEDAVLSIYQDGNTYTATDNLNQRFRYSQEFDDQYNEIENRFNGTSDWLKAPDGQDTDLTEYQWIATKTPNFKKYFGDWETHVDGA